MNIETREIKDWSELTEDQKKDSTWKPLSEALLTQTDKISKSDIRREEYMRRVKEKKRLAECV